MQTDHMRYHTYDSDNRIPLPQHPREHPPALRSDSRGPLPPPPGEPPPLFTPEEIRIHHVHRNGDLIPANGHQNGDLARSNGHKELLRHHHDHKDQKHKHYRKSEPPPANSDYNGNHANTKSLVNRKKKKSRREEQRRSNGDPGYLDPVSLPVPARARHRKGPAPPPPVGRDSAPHSPTGRGPPPPVSRRPNHSQPSYPNEFFRNGRVDEIATEPHPGHDSYWDFLLEGRKMIDIKHKEKMDKKEKEKKGKKVKRKGSPPRNDPYHNPRQSFAGAAPDPYQINDYRHRQDDTEMDLDIGLFEPGVDAPEGPADHDWTTRL